ETRISFNDFVIRAAALALRQVPAANASWSDDAIILWERVDISVAVALDDGLITPIIKGADQKGLAQIARESKDLAERARAGKLKLEEFQGGTFSISNLGMYGIRQFSAVINPPQGGDPGGTARHENRTRRARPIGRNLPELGLHPDQGAAARLRDLSPAASSRSVRLLGKGCRLRPEEGHRALARRRQAIVERRGAPD